MQGTELTKAERLMHIRDLLTDGPLSSRQLLDRLGGRLRNVQRDLHQLENQGLVEPDGQRYRLTRQTPRPLGDVEALAVYSAARLLFHHSSEYHERYEQALEHLTNRLPEHAKQVISRINAAYRERRQATPGPISRTLEVAAQAWLGRHPLLCRYERPGKNALQLRLEVYFIEISAQNKSAYAIGLNRLYPEGGVRVYRISRMRDAAFSVNDTYQVPDDFDPLRFLSNAWGIMVGQNVKVELLFDPQVKARIAEERFACRVLTRRLLSSGHTLLELEVGGWLELVPWVLGWGGAVTVEGPPGLRAYMAAEVTQAARAHCPPATHLSRLAVCRRHT